MSELLEELQRYGELQRETIFQMVTLHPLADESEILKRLNLSANQCNGCDLYWVYAKNMFFVSIWHNDQKAPFTSYHLKAHVKYGHSFYVATRVHPIYRRTIEQVLIYLSKWIAGHGKLLEEQITLESEEAIIIAETDICLDLS